VQDATWKRQSPILGFFVSSYLGHASITITLDRYGQLMPGSQAEAVGLVDDYLERASRQAVTASPRAAVKRVRVPLGSPNWASFEQ
jgi:hypothetical protein